MNLVSQPRVRLSVDDCGHNGMVPPSPRPFPPLPNLVWRRIVYHLSDSLPTLLLLSNLNSDFQEICRPLTTSFFRIISQKLTSVSTTFYYHFIVRLVLEGHLDPAAIFEFYHSEKNNVVLMSSSTTRPGLPDNATEQQVHNLDRLVREAVRASPWIPGDLETEVCARFRDGDPDAALVILLPLCTKLKTLEIPQYLPMCAAMVQKITRQYQRRGITGEQARQKAIKTALRDRRGGSWHSSGSECSPDTLPFSELLILFIGCDQFGCWFPLIEMTPYMGFPSLYRIIFEGVFDQSFPGWPAGDVKCSCPEIYFQQAAVSREAVLSFAQGVDAPSEIRQWYQRPKDGPNNPDDPIWDRVLIKRHEDGSKSIETRFDFEGGNPGYDHAWVSWLWYGKMKDWRRFDEEFCLQGDEHDDEWLCGLLV